jgi:nitroreductase
LNYSNMVSKTWRHHEHDLTPDDYSELVRYATLAASSHNTQPWIFKLESNRILIRPDWSRRCPAVDPDDHHLFASLGCAVENLLLAAKAAGLEGSVSYDESASGVQIDFEKAPAVRSTLFEAIPQRQCSRSIYDGLPLKAEEMKQLKAVSHGNGVYALFITAAEQKDLVARCVAEGNEVLFSDVGWARELKSWIRFNGKEAVRTGDGLYGPSIGSPAVPRWLGLAAMQVGFSAKNQNKKDLEHIRSSSAIAIIYSEADDISHWIEAGRCFQRMALQSTALGLHTAFINQPVEVAKLRSKFGHIMGIGDQRPDLVVRIGRGQELPRSLRRPVEDVIV